MRRVTRLQMSLCLLALVLTAGCGGGEDRSDSQDQAAAENPAPSDTTQAGSGTLSDTPLTVEDIERWERGLDAELLAVQEAGEKLTTAKTGDDTLSAVMGVQEMSTRTVGARAAGVSEDRYGAIRSDLSAAASYLAPHVGGIDTTILSPDQRDELRRMNAAQLKQMEARVPPPVVDALKPRAEALRKKDLELTGARLKNAGM